MLSLRNVVQNDVLLLEISKLNRIHKCKRCLKHICSSCGSNKEQIIDEDGKKTEEKHRICTKCKTDVDLIRDTMRKVDIQTGSMTCTGAGIVL